MDSLIKLKQEIRKNTEREFNSLKLENSKVKAAVSITEKSTEEKDSLLGCLQTELKLAEEAYQKSLDDHKKVVKMYQFELRSQEDEISHLKNINKELLLELQVLENRLTEVDSVILESKNIRQIKRSILE
jgi:myosin heavy subunit